MPFWFWLTMLAFVGDAMKTKKRVEKSTPFK
jgi:hypothetical protein